MAEGKDGEGGHGVDSCHGYGGGAYRPTCLPIDLRALPSLANMPTGGDELVHSGGDGGGGL